MKNTLSYDTVHIINTYQESLHILVFVLPNYQVDQEQHLVTEQPRVLASYACWKRQIEVILMCLLSVTWSF